MVSNTDSLSTSTWRMQRSALMGTRAVAMEVRPQHMTVALLKDKVPKETQRIVAPGGSSSSSSSSSSSELETPHMCGRSTSPC
jgi:hypothetical protein